MVANRISGFSTFAVTAILGTFYPESTNLNPVLLAPQSF